MRRLVLGVGIIAIVLLDTENLRADVLCKVKKTGVLSARPSVCAKKEIAIATLSTNSSTSSSAADLTIGSDITVQDTGPVSSGADSTIGVDLNVNRLNATGGTINTTGMNLAVVGDSGGDSTNIGLSVSTSGADNNYCALFQGGNVGINVSDPDEALEIAGRLHLGEVAAPGDTSGRLYNVGGSLFWNGRQLDSSSGSTPITGVTAGAGLIGGGSSGAVTLAVDAGTTAGKILQLNSSAELPAVSGKNLTELNASNLGSGIMSDSRLSGNVSLLGSTIGLSSEVSGVLPVSNGGTGSASLADLISLGANTVGSYVGSISGGSGIAVSPGAPGEGSAVTVTLDTTAAPSWSGLHSFLSGLNVGTAASSPEAFHLNGRLHLEQGTAPSVTTDKLYNEGGNLFFNGVNLSQLAAGGDITAVTAGTGLTGGGTSGAVTLAIDAGTAANNIVQLNSSAQLPAVSGANLTTLNASNLTTGTIPDARLGGTVSLLGSSINLASSEVTGTLPITNGGTGSTSLNDLIALGANTTGVYVTSVAAGSGLSLNTSGTESIAATLSLNQAFAPTWTGQHTFSGVATDITTAANENFVVSPNGTGKIGFGTSSPSAYFESRLTSTSTTAATEIGARFSTLDTGNVASGTDTTVGVDVDLSRSGSSGGIQDSRGIQVSVAGDSGGAASTKTTGIDVLVGGADVNYAALLNGGRVGIGTTAPSALLDSVFTSASATAGTEIGTSLNVTDSGSIASGTDATIGLDLNVARTGASAGTIGTTGIDIAVTDDGGGTSTATAIRASAAGGDNNYAALFTAGRVGIGTSTPGALFDNAFTSSAATAGTELSARITAVDNGALTTGTDVTTALTVNANRTLATGGTTTTSGITIAVTDDGGGTSTAVALSASASGADSNFAAVFPSGYVGIGTAQPASPLEFTSNLSSATASTRTAANFSALNHGAVASGTDTTNTVAISSTRDGATGGTVNNTALSVSATGETGTPATTLSVGLDVSASGADGNVAAIFSGASVGVGTTIPTLIDTDIPSGSLVVGSGALCVDDDNADCAAAGRTAGNIYAEGTTVTGIDLAEEFPVREDDTVEAGDIVVADSSLASKCVQRTKGPEGKILCARYEQGFVPFVTRSKGVASESKRVLGVVSTDPGVTLGGFKRDELIGYRKVPLALAGRVPVKVNDENGPIEVGDRITPASTPGFGKRAQEGDVIVGIALEPLEESSGAVVVLVVLR